MKNIQVKYYTQSGNTEKLAKAIAQELGCPLSKTDSPLNDSVDVLFLGASLYRFGIEKEVQNFIQTLSPEKVGKVVVFATSCGMETAYGLLKKKLEAQNITVAPENFYCRGKFLAMNKTRPDENDISGVKAFAKKFV